MRKGLIVKVKKLVKVELQSIKRKKDFETFSKIRNRNKVVVQENKSQELKNHTQNNIKKSIKFQSQSQLLKKEQLQKQFMEDQDSLIERKIL